MLNKAIMPHKYGAEIISLSTRFPLSTAELSIVCMVEPKIKLARDRNKSTGKLIAFLKQIKIYWRVI